ncbi:MAG: hypothetical protein, partial [Wufeng shrew rhabdovirus 8]
DSRKTLCDDKNIKSHTFIFYFSSLVVLVLKLLIFISQMSSKQVKYCLGGEVFGEILNISSISSGDVPYEPERLKNVTITYASDIKKSSIDLMYVYDMIKGGKAGFNKYADQFSCFWYSWTGDKGRDAKFDKSGLFKTEQPKEFKPNAESEGGKPSQCLETVNGYLPSDTSTTTLDNIYSLLGSHAAPSNDVKVNKEMLEQTAVAFLGVSPRLAHQSHQTRMDYWRNSSMSRTVVNVLNKVCDQLLTEMITLADSNGLFDMMQQGSRWMTDHAFYVLWARNSYHGTTEYGKYSFFLVGVLGFQFTAFGSLFGLSSRIGMSVTEILVRIALSQSLAMLRAIQKRQKEIEDITFPWFLLCHSLSSGFTHEFSIAVFPIISYISLYATALLEGQSDPVIDIGGLAKFTEKEKEMMNKIARRLVDVRAASLFKPLEAQIDGEDVTTSQAKKKKAGPSAPPIEESSDDDDEDEIKNALGLP